MTFFIFIFDNTSRVHLVDKSNISFYYLLNEVQKKKLILVQLLIQVLI